MSTFHHGGVHPVELERAPDGHLLYVDINDGNIVRVTYNLPTAAATATPTSGAAPLTVELDGTPSTGTVAAGHTVTVRVRLTAQARRRLTRHRRLRAISIVSLVPARGSMRRIDTVFTLRAPARRH